MESSSRIVGSSGIVGLQLGIVGSSRMGLSVHTVLRRRIAVRCQPGNILELHLVEERVRACWTSWRRGIRLRRGRDTRSARCSVWRCSLLWLWRMLPERLIIGIFLRGCSFRILLLWSLCLLCSTCFFLEQNESLVMIKNFFLKNDVPATRLPAR